jgi:hypothetical protein
MVVPSNHNSIDIYGCLYIDIYLYVFLYSHLGPLFEVRDCLLSVLNNVLGVSTPFTIGMMRTNGQVVTSSKIPCRPASHDMTAPSSVWSLIVLLQWRAYRCLDNDMNGLSS